jgi:hypothetical protein
VAVDQLGEFEIAEMATSREHAQTSLGHGLGHSGRRIDRHEVVLSVEHECGDVEFIQRWDEVAIRG